MGIMPFFWQMLMQQARTLAFLMMSKPEDICFPIFGTQYHSAKSAPFFLYWAPCSNISFNTQVVVLPLVPARGSMLISTLMTSTPLMGLTTQRKGQPSSAFWCSVSRKMIKPPFPTQNSGIHIAFKNRQQLGVEVPIFLHVLTANGLCPLRNAFCRLIYSQNALAWSHDLVSYGSTFSPQGQCWV